MGKLKDIAIRELVNMLTEDGQNVINACVQEATYTHRSKNLYDSYGYCVYLNGKVCKMGFLSVSPEAKEPKSWYGKKITGRSEIKKFFENEYSATNGILELVVAATMPYGTILENGSGRVKHKYKVISMSYDKLQQLKTKYGGYVKGLAGRKIL